MKSVEFMGPKLRRSLAPIAFSAVLSACGMVGEGSGNSVTEPGKYQYHNCDQLAASAQTLRTREQELVELTQRAAQSPAGQMVGAMAYRTELVQTRGYLQQIAGFAEQRHCTLQSTRTSERVLW